MELNARDKDLLDSLINPADPEERRYKFDKELQQKVLGMLILDKHFLIQSIGLIKPEYFNDPAHLTICEVLFSFFKKYNQLPSKLILSNEIKERRNSQHVSYFLGELDAVVSTYIPGVQSREYLLDRIREFAKEQAVYLAVSKTIDMVYKKKEDRWQSIWDLWRDALNVDRSYDIGLDYFSTIDERYNKMKESRKNKEIFTSGFEKVDLSIAGGGLARGELGAFVGLSGSGKSLVLCNAAVKNFVLGKRVLYITLEMNEEKTARRFDSIFTGMPYAELLDYHEAVKAALLEEVKAEEDKRRLIIKHFPGGTADVDTFRSYLSQLNLYGFKPDLVIMDYVGELKDIEGIKTYESRQRLVRDFRTLGVEENHCSLTAFQSNRSGRDAQEFGVIDDSSLSDSFGQVRPLDALWSINRMHSELIEYQPGHKSYFGQIYVIKHRDGQSRFHVNFMQSSDTLLMSQIGDQEYADAMSKATKTKGNNVKKIDIT